MIKILSKGSLILTKQYSDTLNTAKNLFFVQVNYIPEIVFLTIAFSDDSKYKKLD